MAAPASFASQVRTSENMFLWTDEDWLYLVVVLALFNLDVIGRLRKSRMTTDLVSDALTMMWLRRHPATEVLHHSIHGSHYASMVSQCKLAEFGMTCSTRHKWNCWDNLPTESCFNSFKSERYKDVRYTTQVEMKTARFDYIDVFYNRKRQYSISDMSRRSSSSNAGSVKEISKKHAV